MNPSHKVCFLFIIWLILRANIAARAKEIACQGVGVPPPASIQDQCKNKNTSGQNSETSLFMKNYDYPHHAPVSVQLAVSAIHNSVRGKNRLHPVMPPTAFIKILINSFRYFCNVIFTRPAGTICFTVDHSFFPLLSLENLNIWKNAALFAIRRTNLKI